MSKKSKVFPKSKIFALFTVVLLLLSGTAFFILLFSKTKTNDIQQKYACTDEKFKITDTQFAEIERKAEEFITSKNFDALISLSAPDVVVDCTNYEELANKYEMLPIPQICSLENPINTNLRFYTIGIPPEGVTSTKGEVVKKIVDFDTQYGPFSKVPGEVGTHSCGRSILFSNNQTQATMQIIMYKRLNSNDTIVMPSLFYPGTQSLVPKQ